MIGVGGNGIGMTFDPSRIWTTRGDKRIETNSEVLAHYEEFAILGRKKAAIPVNYL